jgi:uncharacterized protein (DUF362 family)
MKNRRDFIKTGLALGASLPLVNLEKLFAADSPAPPAGNLAAAPATAKSILVAVRDGERAPMLDKALAELGGMGAYVKKGQSVVVKPNAAFDLPPERGANTHPELIRRVVQLCFDAGAKSVSICDNGLDQWQRAYASSGMEQVAKDTGARLANGKDETLYREMSVPDGKKLRTTKVHSLMLDSDVVINVPVLKHHGGARMTACMKNLMGVVWDRSFYHRTDLQQCIADFLTLKKPTLNILDAYHPMVQNGPRGSSANDLVVLRTLLVSSDIVAIDAAAAKLLNHEPADIRHVAIAADMKLGTMDLEQVDVRRLKLA